jgi:hypothetical protein
MEIEYEKRYQEAETYNWWRVTRKRYFTGSIERHTKRQYNFGH